MNKLILFAAISGTLVASASVAHAGSYGYGLGLGTHSHAQPVGQYARQCHYVTVKVLKWINGKKVIVLEKKRVCILVRAFH